MGLAAIEPEPAAAPESASPPQSLQTRRDWAIMRLFSQLKVPGAVLSALRMSDLDDPDEPWSASRVQERHELLCRCVRHAARLVGTADPSECMSELTQLATA